MHYLPAVILLFGWLMPLHFPPWVSWHSEVLVFFSVLLAAWMGIVQRVRNGQYLMLPLLAWPFVALVFLILVQSGIGLISFAGDAVMLALYATICVISLMLGFAGTSEMAASGRSSSGEGDKNRALTCLAVVLMVGAFISAIVAFIQVLELYEQTSWINRMQYLRRPGGNLGQPNHLATLLVMGLASLLLLYESRKLSALPSTVILLVLCAALAITESRAGVLSFMLLTGWWVFKKRRVGFRLSSWVVGITGLGLLVFFGAWPSIFVLIQQGVSTGASTEVNTAAGSRLVVWPQLLDAVAQRPWWGWGLGEVPKAHNAVAHGYATSEAFSYSHNILLDLALGMGVPLTALLVLLTGFWLWRRVRIADHLLSWYCLAVTLPFAVHSMLEFPFAYAYFLVPVMFALGVLEGMAGIKPALRIRMRTAAGLLLGISAVLAWSAVEYFVIEEDFRVARFEALRVGQTPPNYARPDIFLLTQLDALLGGARIVPRPGMTAEDLELTKKVALRYPWTATQNRYALSLALNGNPEEAMRQLTVMRAMQGEKKYAPIRASWVGLGQDTYPQLRELSLP